MNVETLYADEDHPAKPSPASNFLRRLITILWWAVWGLFGVFVISLVISLLGLAGIEPLKSQIFTETSPTSAVIMLVSGLIYISVLLVILRQLQQVCKTLAAGDPFVPENAKRLRLIWIAIAVGEILRQGGSFFFGYLNRRGVIEYAPDGNTLSGTDVTIELRIYVWFLVLAFIIFAEVFREGARLRQEQKLTV
jgi:hypothetical protein